MKCAAVVKAVKIGTQQDPIADDLLATLTFRNDVGCFEGAMRLLPGQDAPATIRDKNGPEFLLFALNLCRSTTNDFAGQLLINYFPPRLAVIFMAVVIGLARIARVGAIFFLWS